MRPHSLPLVGSDAERDLPMTAHDAYRSLRTLASVMRHVPVLEPDPGGHDEGPERWTLVLGGMRRRVFVEPTVDEPGTAFGWRSIAGPVMDGMLSFLPLGGERVRVRLHLLIEARAPEAAGLGDLAHRTLQRIATATSGAMIDDVDGPLSLGRARAAVLGGVLRAPIRNRDRLTPRHPS